jgi:LacI family transcriptional regulator
MARATIAEVAKQAGVSKATVSRVLSGNYAYLRPETRQRVEATIEALAYRPSSIARSLTSKRTQTAGVMIADIGNPFYPDVLRGIEDAALKEGYNVFLCNTNYDLTRGMDAIHSLVDKRVDGVLIMTSAFSPAWLEELDANHVPVVILDWEVQARGSNVSSIGVDFRRGIQAAVEHLINLGHRRFAHVSGPALLPTSSYRSDAFLQALGGFGIAPAEVAIVEGNLRIDGGRRALSHLLAPPDPPTAVLAANDLTAIGLLQEAHARGVRVPHDLSVVGIDDIWLAAQTDPPLTTVALPRYEIGALAMRLLFDLLNQPGDHYIEGVTTRVRTTLVVRESTGVSGPQAPPAPSTP